MEISGKIKFIGNNNQVSQSFTKRELVVTTDENYPQHILIEFNQDRCDLLDNFKVGQDVKVSINLRGREWQNPKGEMKYFNSIQGWRIENLESSSAPSFQANQEQHNFDKPKFSAEEEEDLPF